MLILLQKNPMENIQRRRTKEDMFPVIEAWQHSGLSKKSFCKQQGIIKSVFFYWYKKYREEKEPGGFIPITVRASESAIVEIQYPNGVILKLPAGTPASLVRQYLVL